MCALAFVVPASGVRAATSLYFDAGSGPAVWDNTTANWATTFNGPYNYPWADGADAMFQGTPGTVNVSGTISSVNSITFGVDGYTLNGGTIESDGHWGQRHCEWHKYDQLRRGWVRGVDQTLRGDVDRWRHEHLRRPYDDQRRHPSGHEPAALPNYGGAGNVVVNNGGTLTVSASDYGPWTATNLSTLLSNAVFNPGSVLGIEVPGTSGLNYDENISGSLGLTKLGTGGVGLTGYNTYSGPTTVLAGGISVSGQGASPNSAVILADSPGVSFSIVDQYSVTIASLSGGGPSGGNVYIGTSILSVGDSSDTTFAAAIRAAPGAEAPKNWSSMAPGR